MKNPPANAGGVCSIPGSGRSLGRGNGNSLHGHGTYKSYGQRRLVGTVHRGHKRVGHLRDYTIRLLQGQDIIREGQVAQ